MNENSWILAIFESGWVIMVWWKKDMEPKNLPEN